MSEDSAAPIGTGLGNDLELTNANESARYSFAIDVWNPALRHKQLSWTGYKQSLDANEGIIVQGGGSYQASTTPITSMDVFLAAETSNIPADTTIHVCGW